MAGKYKDPEYMKKYKEANKDKMRSYDKKYRDNNKEVVSERKKETKGQLSILIYMPKVPHVLPI